MRKATIMRTRHAIAPLLRTALTLVLLFAGFGADAQLTDNTDRNTSKQSGDQSECAIAKNPLDHQQLFILCNEIGVPGLFAARSTDYGQTWTYPDAADKTIADGDAGQGPAAWCDPTLAWDNFGNLFITYIDQAGGNIITILSTDGGATFANLASFPGNVDQPTVVAASGAVWVVWNQNGQMAAQGAAVTALGTVGAFNAIQMIPGTNGCSYGDIAISPAGKVVQVCQNPTGGEGPATIFVNTDVDGLGAGNFGAIVNVTTTNVGGYDYIPAQSVRSVDAEAGLVYDFNAASPHFGRLYLVYTDEVTDESNDLDITVRTSDDDGATWSGPTRVNDDATTRSQFFPKIASNPATGNIGICWADCRNSGTNTAIQEVCTIATPAGFPAFIDANKVVSDGSFTSNGSANEFGDYAGITYLGTIHPAWGDTSNSTSDNPDGTSNIDAYTDRVSGGAAAGNEGDPHITTVDNVHFDFQGAGEFIALRGEGVEIQTRQVPVATTFFPNPDPHDGLATCVSVNSALA
ncbi:MAG TPA: sialidase family protein, partial [Thermoanaerobaculia bacterium]|nr:sialidase family protein [Thermoanaerobaculia bacterium]